MNQTEDSALTTVNCVQRSIEFALCLVCFFLNVYFAKKFGRIAILNSNIRVLLVSIHLTTAGIALLHPTIQHIPYAWYSIQEGHHVAAAFIYSLLFVTQICVYLIDTKFLMISIERHMALRQRADYEQRDGSLAIRILVCTAVVICLVLSVRTLLIFKAYPHISIDEKLQLALNIEHWAPMLVAPHLVAAVCWAIGAWQFKQLQLFTTIHYFSGRTLTESYQIKQVDGVIKILRPLLLWYAVLVFACCFFLSIVLYLVYVRGFALHSPIGLIFVNTIYLCVALYNLVSTVYLFFYYRPLRIAVARDIYAISGFRLNMNEVVPKQTNAALERENHFEYLRSVWK